MSGINEQEVYDAIFGSGCLQWPWWRAVAQVRLTALTPDGVSQVTGFFVAVEDPHKDGHFVNASVSVGDLLEAMHRIARGEGRFVSESCRRECRKFLADSDSADIDADIADQILQMTVLREVFYA